MIHSTKIQREQLDEFFNSQKDIFSKPKTDYAPIAAEMKQLAKDTKLTEKQIKTWIAQKKHREKCKNSQTNQGESDTGPEAGTSGSTADQPNPEEDDLEFEDDDEAEVTDSDTDGICIGTVDSDTDWDDEDLNEGIMASLEENYTKKNDEEKETGDGQQFEGEGKGKGEGKKSSSKDQS